MDEVMKFLRRHENKEGNVGQFVRSCILLCEQSEFMSRDELLKSDQMQLFLDCFPSEEIE